MKYGKKIALFALIALFSWTYSAAGSSYISSQGKVRLPGITFHAVKAKVYNWIRQKNGKIRPVTFSSTRLTITVFDQADDVNVAKIKINGKEYTFKVKEKFSNGKTKTLSLRFSRHIHSFALSYNWKTAHHKTAQTISHKITLGHMSLSRRMSTLSIKVDKHVPVKLDWPKPIPGIAPSKNKKAMKKTNLSDVFRAWVAVQKVRYNCQFKNHTADSLRKMLKKIGINKSAKSFPEVLDLDIYLHLQNISSKPIVLWHSGDSTSLSIKAKHSWIVTHHTRNVFTEEYRGGKRVRLLPGQSLSIRLGLRTGHRKSVHTYFARPNTYGLSFIQGFAMNSPMNGKGLFTATTGNINIDVYPKTTITPSKKTLRIQPKKTLPLPAKKKVVIQPTKKTLHIQPKK